VPAENVPAEVVYAESAAAGAAHAVSSARTADAAVAAGSRARGSVTLTPGEPSAWMVVPVLAGLAILILLGIHPPGELTSLFTQAVAQLRGVGR
jgi:hydrogenase-4 component F